MTQSEIETRERIKHLADVAIFLFSTNENKFDTEYFVAKESLIKFKQMIDKLKLEAVSQEGMDALVKFLNSKIESKQKSDLKL